MIIVNPGANVVKKKKKVKNMIKKRTGKPPTGQEFMKSPEYKIFTDCNLLPGFK